MHAVLTPFATQVDWHIGVCRTQRHYSFELDLLLKPCHTSLNA